MGLFTRHRDWGEEIPNKLLSQNEHTSDHSDCGFIIGLEMILKYA